jgi:hypothetical protein
MVKARKRKWEIEAQGGFELGFFAGQEMEHEAFELGPSLLLEQSLRLLITSPSQLLVRTNVGFLP